MQKLAVVLGLSFAAISLACNQNTDPETAAYWIDRLDKEQTRQEALTKLGKLGDTTAVPAVLKWFEQEGDWQPAAAYTLGQLGDKSVAPKLIAAIDFQVGTGRDARTTLKNRTNQNIARALAMLKAPEAAEPLVNLLKTRELKTKEAVIRSLGKLGDAKAAEPLAAIASTETQPFIRKVAIQALGELGDPAGVPALIKNLYVELPGTSFYFESRLSLIQVGKAAVPLLVQTLERKNQEVEDIRLPSGDPIAPEAIEAKAAFVLGALKATEHDELIVKTAEKHWKQYNDAKGGPMFAGVVGAVMENCFTLSMLGSQRAVPLLEKIAMETDANLRVAATEALTRLGSRNSTQVLLKAAQSGPLLARRHAVEAISLLGGNNQLAAFEALANAGGNDVKPADMKGLVEGSKPRLLAAKECAADASCWTKKLADPTVAVRERAAYELGWLGAEDALDALYKAAEDEEASVRMATLASLDRLGSKADPNRLQDILEKWEDKIAYKDPNAMLRRLIGRLGGPTAQGAAPKPTGEPTADAAPAAE